MLKLKLKTTCLLLGLLFCASTIATPVINFKRILNKAPSLNPMALKYAAKGYYWALHNHLIRNRNILTLVDFTKPAKEKRMWVIDLKKNKVLMHLLTTHGKGSGLFYAKHFSNRVGANQTSLGVYATLNSYYGTHGLSERLQGLEKGINDNAYKRAIVVHPARYAAPGFAKRYNRTGRSWGCFGLDPAVSKKFIDITKGGSILFVYAKDEQRDKYLQDLSTF